MHYLPVTGPWEEKLLSFFRVCKRFMAQALSLLAEAGCGKGGEKIAPAYRRCPITCSSGKEASQVSDGEPGEPQQRSGISFFFRHMNQKDIKVPFGKGAHSVLQRSCNSPLCQPLPVLLVFVSRRKNGPHPQETHLRGSICEGHNSGHLEAREASERADLSQDCIHEGMRNFTGN